MPDETPDQPAYPVAVRVAAALGLALLGMIAFAMLDVALGGRLTSPPPCDGCDDPGEKM